MYNCTFDLSIILSSQDRYFIFNSWRSVRVRSIFFYCICFIFLSLTIRSFSLSLSLWCRVAVESRSRGGAEEEPEKENKKQDPATQAELHAAKQRETMPLEERTAMFRAMLAEKEVKRERRERADVCRFWRRDAI